uniref:Uncharacterized protein n=1 Tax=Oryza meridionalis TaxID=40149 RepID=A0A0E0DWE2_9ORYZ
MVCFATSPSKESIIHPLRSPFIRPLEAKIEKAGQVLKQCRGESRSTTSFRTSARTGLIR